MASKTLIAWTDATFNIAWGCTKVSPGCTNCYADGLADRYGFDVWGPKKDRRTFGPKHWAGPLKWNRDAEREGKRRRVFCSSMCDWAEDHPTIDQERSKLWPLIQATPWLDWQLLTKRAERIEDLLPDCWPAIRGRVWLGASIENNEYAWRADYLREIKDAAVRFVSYEPALGPLDQLNLSGLQWTIYGGESGPGFRPEDKQWARDMRDRCRAAGVAFFHKQSAAFRTETGIELDGEVVREYPRYALPVVAAGSLFDGGGSSSGTGPRSRPVAGSSGKA